MIDGTVETNGARTATPIGVVVASWRGLRGLPACLDRIAKQRDDAVDVAVVTTGPVDPQFSSKFSWCQWIEAPLSELIPGLWKRGIEAVRGEGVLITIAQCEPREGWIAAARVALERPELAAAAGPIEPPTGGSPIAWAVFLQRYHSFLNVPANKSVNEIPADNAVYRRKDLERYHDAWSDGFWEPRVHARIRASGRALFWLPEMRVCYAETFGFRDFIAQRFQHGRRFGADRAANWGLSRRIFGVLASPLIPIVFGAKILIATWRWGKHRAAAMASLPALAVFVTSWAAGETCGYVSGRREPFPRINRDTSSKAGPNGTESDPPMPVAPLAETNNLSTTAPSCIEPPLVSVVIASVNGVPHIVECLEHLANQDADVPYEAIVVDACGPEVRDEIRRRFPREVVHVIGVPQRLSIPKLRAIGMSRARGRMIAILEDHCNVAKGWLRAVQRAHENGWQAIGGAVENGSTERLTDWAVFFCEYARFMLPLDKGAVHEITGNNSVYDRETLGLLGSELSDEVWEGFLHQRMKELGVPFHCDPELVVSHKKEFGFWYFMSQRYHYSRSFGGIRVAHATRRRKLLMAMATLVLPPVLLWRIARTVFAKGRERLTFVKAVPLIFVFTLAWAWGEFIGSLAGPGDSLLRVE